MTARFANTCSRKIAARISSLCRRNRIPVNVIDSPSLSTFALLSVHVDGPLQVGVTTNGRGCKLASRIRREISCSLPAHLGSGVAKLGELRRRIHEEDHAAQDWLLDENDGLMAYDADDTSDQSASFNKLVPEEDGVCQAGAAATAAAKNQRMRWLSQVCEYWPLKRLATMSDSDMETILKSYHDASFAPSSHSPTGAAKLPPPLPPPPGRLILAGSGPGHPSLLTRATHNIILSSDLILADKLVPSGVMDLIPRRTPVVIARKFPGNADAAQHELLSQALAAVRAGKTVLRLKQGDPFVYGRGGEEYGFFASRGMASRVTVLPGLTSALSAPLLAGIPSTQRDVADQILICTGTGKKGRPPMPPEFVPSRTVVFLMALHRIGALVAELTTTTAVLPPVESDEQDATTGSRALFPADTPCAVIERASCADQRVMRTTLRHVARAVETEGSRPPGLLVVGRACEALVPLERGRMWAVEDGLTVQGLDDVAGVGLMLGGTGCDAVRTAVATAAAAAAAAAASTPGPSCKVSRTHD